MKVQTPQPQLNLRKLSTPTPPSKPPAPEQPGDAFYEGASGCSKLLTASAGGFVGMKLGFVAGGLLGAASGSASAVLGYSLAGSLALGLAGVYGMAAASDFAGRLGSDLDTTNPARGEALGRNILGAGLAYTFGSGANAAALHAGLAAGTGVINYAIRG